MYRIINPAKKSLINLQFKATRQEDALYLNLKQLTKCNMLTRRFPTGNRRFPSLSLFRTRSSRNADGGTQSCCKDPQHPGKNSQCIHRRRKSVSKLCIHLIGTWMSLRAGPHAVGLTKMSCPCWESNLGRPARSPSRCRLS
jgi:hypothetical protein